MSREFQLDLIVLVADKDARESLLGILDALPKRGKTRKFHYDIKQAPQHDSQARAGATELLRPFLSTAARALVVFDREGSGAEHLDPVHIEQDVVDRLEKNGWEGRAEAIVIDPELEFWVWSHSPHVDAVLGWKGRQPTLRAALRAKGLLLHQSLKPSRPKEAMRWALRESGVPWSASLFRRLAERVSYSACTDRAFQKLLSTLERWFPPS